MTRWRFPLLVAVLAVLVAGGAFAVGLQVLDDGAPDPPPSGAAPGDDDPAGGDASSEDQGRDAPPPNTAPLPTPAWIVVAASESSEAAALPRAEAVAEQGQPAGVLRSDDYPSLSPGLWVAYAGPYADAGQASAASDALADSGVPGTYVRCAGTAEQCDGDS